MGTDIHFSPLALTHALPFLPLAQGDIDYQADLSPYRAAKASSWTMRT